MGIKAHLTCRIDLLPLHTQYWLTRGLEHTFHAPLSPIYNHTGASITCARYASLTKDAISSVGSTSACCRCECSSKSVQRLAQLCINLHEAQVGFSAYHQLDGRLARLVFSIRDCLPKSVAGSRLLDYLLHGRAPAS
jgi:hypothetical protein